MSVGKRIITLLPETQARKGERFKVNISSKCFKCKNFNFCVRRLRKNFTYEVVEIREVKHFCPAVKCDMVVVVAIELPVKIFLPKKIAFEGAIVELPNVECAIKKCRYKKFCYREGLKANERVKILKIIIKSFMCPLGRQLSLVLVQPLD